MRGKTADFRNKDRAALLLFNSVSLNESSTIEGNHQV